MSLRTTVLPRTTLGASQTRVRRVANAWRASVLFDPSEKWSLAASVQYDFEREAFIRREVLVGRDVHDFVLEFHFERDDARDELKFSVTLVPKFFGNDKYRRRFTELVP